MELGEFEQAVKKLERHDSAPAPNEYSSLIKQCSRHKSLQLGKRVHQITARSEEWLGGGRFLRNMIMEMYGKCGSPEDVKLVFDTILDPNSFSYTMLMLGYGQNGNEKEALQVFRRMDLDGVFPNEVTYVSALAVCSRLGDLEVAKVLHWCLEETGLESSVMLQTAVCSMYTGCSRLDLARNEFEKMVERSVVTWNAMLSAYARNGLGKQGRELFWRMELEGCKPDSVTFLCIVELNETLGDVEQVFRLQRRVRETGHDSHISVQTTFLNFYGKHGSIEGARRLFEGVRNRNSVCWNSMIGIYSQHGMGREALELYLRMRTENSVQPDEVTFITVLSGCASVGELETGRMVHRDIVSRGLQKDTMVMNSLLNMYGRCGSLEFAMGIFTQMKLKMGSSWTVMITQYAEHGKGIFALELFKEMQVEGFKPEEITYLIVLSICSHLGMLKEGKEFFFGLDRDYGILYVTEHYGCVVDLLARAGMLELAEEYLELVPSRFTPVAWTALLTSCRVHGDVERGTRAAARMFELDPEDCGTYSILKQLYTNAGRWDDLARLSEIMEAKGLSIRGFPMEDDVFE